MFHTPKLIVRVIMAASLFGAFFLFTSHVVGKQVQAEAEKRAVYQETSYPGPDPQDTPTPGNDGYPEGDTNTPVSGATPSASGTPSANAATAFPTSTVTLTPTLAPNVFRTEDSEMNGAQVTLPASETPGPTLTAYFTPVPSKTLALSSPTAAVIKKNDGIGSSMDWGMFWVGFSIPVVAICGAVLYLLDRRPNLFKRPR